MLAHKTLPIKKELFSSLMYDYLSRHEGLKEFYSFYPDKDGFKNAIQQIASFTCDRRLLVSEIKKQNELVTNTSEKSKANLELLLNENTYTITTGHQLCLFTGPLYFIYKIFSVINLAEKLKTEFPANNFVPVYWMASEDHDFAEVNHLSVYGKKLEWNSDEKGAVGDFSTAGLKEVVVQLKEILGDSVNASRLIQLFEEAYLKHTSLALATRFLVNELFGKYGLIVLDGNSADLKRSFAAFFEKDIFENTPFKKVDSSIKKLTQSKYEAQVNPREINCFYMENGLRARIEKSGNSYKVIDTSLTFSEAQLKDLIFKSPEKISPNVVLRPCYQQYILPNLSYVGGPGELAYWLEYKEMFEALGLFFPVLTPRKFVTILDINSLNKLSKLGLEMENIMENEQEMIKLYLEKSNKSFNLEEYKKSIENLFQSISSEMNKIDKTLVSSAEAEKQKNLNSLSVLEQKATRAIKAKSDTEVNQIKNIKSKLYPNGVPQERVENFATHYAKWGDDFMNVLKDKLTYDLNKNTIDIVFEN